MKLKTRDYSLSGHSPSYDVQSVDGNRYVLGMVPTAYGYVTVYHERDDASGRHYSRFSFIWQGRVFHGNGSAYGPLTDRMLTIAARRFVKEIVHP
jgi:hypothetical protein